jgi:hypothetical protein
LTFGVRGRHRRWSDQAQGIAIFFLGLALTSGALALTDALVPTPGRGLEVTVLVLANLTATLVRFVGLRWVFRSRLATQPS